MNAWLFLIPVFAALLGWFANRIAIKMLFYPKQPKRVLGITFHGIFPKRQKELSEKIGKLVSKELFSFSELEEKITSESNLKKVMPVVEAHIDDFLRNKLKIVYPMIGMFIGEKTIGDLKKVFVEELETIFPDVMKNYMTTLKTELDLETIVVKKISGFSGDRLESSLYKAIAKELRYFEIFGAILGFSIGLLQLILTLLIS